MTTPSADVTSTPGAATGEPTAPAAAPAATTTQPQGGDQAAGAPAATAPVAPAATTTEPAATTTATAPATETTATAAPKGAEALFEGVITAEDTKAKPAEAPAEPAKPAATENHPEWFVAEGVKGTGAPPAYFLADKYKTLADQAAAYPELQKKFGGFTGAPKDGKYEIKLPEGVTGELDMEHPMTQGLVEWALKRNMSQDAFNEAIGLFAEYEAAQVPSLEDIHAEVGENAIARIHSIGNWAKVNLMPEELATFMNATKGPNAGEVLKAYEALIAKTRQPVIGKPGQDAQTGATNTEAQIHAMQARVNPATGKRFYEENATYRANVEKLRADMYRSREGNKGII